MSWLRIEVSRELHKHLKLYALQNDMTLRKLVPVALEAYVTPVVEVETVKAAGVSKIAKLSRQGSHQTYELHEAMDTQGIGNR